MSSYEVSEPILNSPYEEPKFYWYIREGEPQLKKEGRHEACPYITAGWRRRLRLRFSGTGTFRFGDTIESLRVRDVV